MREVWSDEARIQRYLDFEKALAVTQRRLGVIPLRAAEEIAAHCNVREMDFANWCCEKLLKARRKQGSSSLRAFAPLREMLLLFQGFFHSFRGFPHNRRQSRGDHSKSSLIWTAMT